MTSPLPAVFISHGSPMLALEQEPTSLFLRELPARFAKPDAIIIASAHWETAEPAMTGAAYPETIHDFSGFPQELYKLHYPAPGDPALAERITALLATSGIKAIIAKGRGLDHGAWDPLLLMYPKADIPVIQLSVQPGHDAAWHYRMGQALATLRKENILVIGSGNLSHNLREAFRSHHDKTPEWVTEFAEWVADKVARDDIDSLLGWEELAPHALRNHPTPEHFLPFFVALGAGGAKAQRFNTETALGVLAMDVYIF